MSLWVDPGKDPPLFVHPGGTKKRGDRVTLWKVSGSDEAINEVLSIVVRLNPSPLLSAFSICLRKETFPAGWKRTNFFLLHKEPSKPIKESSSYRLISLLDGVEKMMEKLVLTE